VPKAKIVARLWTPEDILSILACHQAAYPDYDPKVLYDERVYRMQLEAFPEGQCLVEMDGQVVGYATSLIVQLDDDAVWYTYSEITGAGTFNTHNPGGDTLYGADIAVRPAYRRRGIAARLYGFRKKLMRRYNLRRMIAYGRIPGYKEVAGKMTAEEYVEAALQGELKDASLSAHLKAGYEVKRVMLDFVGDDSSMNHCTLLEMPNTRYKPHKRTIAAGALRRPVRKIRVCAAQYLMRKISTWEEFEQNVQFFVDTADEYHCHFLLMPEYFTAQLFSTMPRDLDSREAMRELAKLTPRYCALFTDLASRYGLYIIAGSQPVDREGKLYNVAHLFTPGGNFYTQDKLHITPAERKLFGIYPGESLNVFETPMGRIAMQICYDIEFPEAARLLRRSGAEVFFVPFSTDDRKAYFRVRYTAQARAVENIAYVVLSGNVGNLPSVRSYLINYGQSAIFSPSDFPFPMKAILAEAEPNIETVIIADLDLSSLQQQQEIGSVRPFYDLRPDLYNLEARRPVRIIKTD